MNNIFKNLEVLDSETHKGLKFTPVNNFNHTKELHFIPTVLGEVPMLSNTYPLVFASDEGGGVSLTAVLGLAENKNAFVNEQGQWTSQIVPVLIQSYPFIGARVNNNKNIKDSKKEKMLCVDVDAPHFKGKKGDKLFDGNKPTELLNKCLKMIEEFDFSNEQTILFCEEISNSNILEYWQESSEYGNINFKRINVDLVNNLPTKKITEWAEKGYLHIIMHLLQSQRCWKEIETRLKK